MATKYQRESTAPQAGGKYHRILDYYAVRKNWPIRRRLLLTYMGLLFFGLLALALHWLRFAEAPVPPRRTVGQVLSKSTGGAGWFELAVPLDEESVVVVKTPVDRATWERFSPGDYIGVYYRKAPRAKTIEVLELGLVALPAPDR